MRKLSTRFLLFNRQLSDVNQYVRYKYDFLNGIYFIVCIISFILGLIRWYESAFLALLTLTFSVSGLGLLYYLKYHKDQIERVCTLVLIQLYVFSATLYLLNFPHTLRLSIFFLLLSTALFLKGRIEGFRWLLAILATVFIGDIFFINRIGYSHLDILVSSFSMVCLFFIVNSYEKVKEMQTQDLKALNLVLEQKVEERTYALNQANKLLEQEKLTLKKLSYTDQLTGLYNRYKVTELFDYEKKQIKRYKTHLSLIIIDIDFFKPINDTFGHTVGDLILCELADVLRTIVRKTDMISRWGGEEFVILTPKTDVEQARILAESIRTTIKKHQFSHGIHLTVSFGVTSFQENDTLERIILRADKALYKAKNDGRDTVKVYTLQYE